MDDLDIVNKYFLKQLINSLKISGVQIDVGSTIIAMLDFKFGVKSQMRLESASNIL